MWFLCNRRAYTLILNLRHVSNEPIVPFEETLTAFQCIERISSCFKFDIHAVYRHDDVSEPHTESLGFLFLYLGNGNETVFQMHGSAIFQKLGF